MGEYCVVFCYLQYSYDWLLHQQKMIRIKKLGFRSSEIAMRL